jgi:hypothetical protein
LDCGRGLPQSKTLSRQPVNPIQLVGNGIFETALNFISRRARDRFISIGTHIFGAAMKRQLWHLPAAVKTPRP